MCLVILDETLKAQCNDEFLTDIQEILKSKPPMEFANNQEGILEFEGRTCVLDGPNVREQLLEEAH